MPIFYVYFPVLFLFLVFVSLFFCLYHRSFFRVGSYLWIFMILGV